MAQTISIFANKAYPVGAYLFGPATVPAGVTFVELDLATTGTGPGVTVTITIERSTDGGATWLVVNQAEMDGGVDPRTGQPANLSAAITQDVTPGQQYRSNLVVSGGPATLTASATLS